MRPLVLCAQAAGYGPASKALAISQRLAAAGEECVFIGQGLAFEFAKRTKGFIRVIEAGPESTCAREVFDSASAVLSVMDVDFARLALEMPRPLFVADSLAWMRRPFPKEFLSAHRYWVQDFPGLQNHLTGVFPEPCVVGPIVSAAIRGEVSSRADLLVCLGGYETPYATANDDSGYARFVVGGILDSDLINTVGGEVLVIGGSRCIERLKREYADSGLSFDSMSHGEAESVRAGAKVVLTAPGLTSTLECFRSGRPTFFLPPQNYSQWAILDRLREAGVAPCSYHWADSLPDCGLQGLWAIGERVSTVRRAIGVATDDPAAQRQFRDKLRHIGETSMASLARKQRAFFDSFGPNGASVIAREITNQLTYVRR